MKNINTASVCTPVFAVSLAFAAGAARADAAYSYENDNKTYVVTVEAGETATLADGDAPAGVLKENNVTNFVKRGDGTLKVSANLSSFAGDLYVEDGVYSSSPQTGDTANTTAGATGTKYKIFVLDGATFDFDTEVSGHFLEREWHITGRGYDDPEKGELGALHSTASGQALNAVSGKVVLEGDTMMRYTGGVNVAFVGCPMDMQNHDLTLKSDARTLGPVIQCNNYDYDETFRRNAGNVLVEGCANISGYLSWLYCSPAGAKSLIVNTNATLILNSMHETEVLATAYHALVLRKGAKINITGGNDKVFCGPVTFDDPDRNVITSSSSDSRYQINLRGSISGSGFSVQGRTKVEIRKVNDISNTSTNGMVVANGAYVDLRSTGDVLLNVTDTGGDIVVSNGTVCSGYTYYSFEKLKAITFAGNCTWAGYAYFDYDSPGSVASGDSRTATKFSNLYFTGNPAVAFSTNVVTATLHGLGSVSNEVDVSESRPGSYEEGTATRCDNFKIRTAWTFNVSDVLAGGCLAASGKIHFDSEATIRMNGTDKPTDGNLSRVVAYAEGGIYGLDSAVLEVDEDSRWRLSAGSDGKTLIATYLPNGMAIIVR